MARAPRIDVGGEIYHVINRANGRLRIFETDRMYLEFVVLLKEIKALYDIEVLAFVVMSNHWHLLLRPKNDGDLGRAMQWLGTTHTRRFHTKTGTVGNGHLYQGRYKSFLVQGDKHFLTVLKYIERNPVRAKLSNKAEDWKWGSANERMHPSSSFIAESPTVLPADYIEWINTPEQAEVLKDVRQSVQKGLPFGAASWQKTVVQRYDLSQLLRRSKEGNTRT